MIQFHTLQQTPDQSVHSISGGGQRSGWVALVGAGPGDPELLTLKALRLLQQADVVLYDRLVAAEVLALASATAELVYVGKARSHHALAQDEINGLMIALAQRGLNICRLTGGDPFIFGRGGEELEALTAAGIPCQVVPGVTAATGCMAYAGIPLTHRDHAQSVTFVTGHGKNSKDQPTLDWAMLARAGQTVVFYMGLAHLSYICAALQAHGAEPSRPAAVVENGTRTGQRVVRATLHDLAEQVSALGLKSPALIVVGEVVTCQTVVTELAQEQKIWMSSAA
jgi:uroporphyrin-III C-methyltransferase/precorrin-2 dehydrogenase/sirohydrochlorin ferrochelatase